MKKLSVIIPFYNEAENIQKIYNELHAVCQDQLSSYEIEIIFMDNHSTDQSFEIASRIASTSRQCQVVRLSRNFGYQANILTGFLKCKGDAAIQLDADGEDDPALIPRLVEKWEEGNQVVYGIRRARAENSLITLQRKIFYRLLNSLSSISIPPDAGDFRLIDRKVIEALRHFKEANPYIRGLVSYAGFKQTGIAYDRRNRYEGQSKFNWWGYVSMALSGIAAFSSKPLHLATWAGVLISFLSFFGGAVYLSMYIMGKVQVHGFTTLILTQLFLAGVQLLCLGVLGKYIGSIFDEVKERPLSIIEATYPDNEQN